MAKSYAEKRLDPLWQKKRLSILTRDMFACQLCGDTTTELHVHHFCYAKSGLPWDVTDDCLITYCKCCHSLIEYLKGKSLILVSVYKVKYKEGSKLYALPLSECIIYAEYLNKERQIKSLRIIPKEDVDIFHSLLNFKIAWHCPACGNINNIGDTCTLCTYTKTENLQECQESEA